MSYTCNAFLALERKDFLCRWTALRPDKENVSSRVNIAIVRASALGADPVSYSKLCDTSRAADCTAVRTHLGSPSFVGLNKIRSAHACFISEHISQHRPTCIERRFSHPSFSEALGAYVADDDNFIFSRYLCANLVKVISSGIRYLGVNSPHSLSIVSALLYSKGVFIFSVIFQRGDRVPVAACSEVFKTQVYADFPVTCRKKIVNIALKTDIPSATSVLSKASRLDGGWDISGFPKMEISSKIGNARPIEFYSSPIKRNPPQRFSRTGARTKSWGMAGCVARYDKLLANLTNRIRVQPEFGGASSGQFYQIKVSWPSSLRRSLFVIVLGFSLNFAAIIPDKIHRACMSVEMPTNRPVLNSVLEGQNHANFISCFRENFKETP